MGDDFLEIISDAQKLENKKKINLSILKYLQIQL